MLFYLLIRIFEINLQDTFTRFEKYSSKLNFVEFRPRSVEKINFLYILSLKLDISCSFIRIFEINLQDTFTRLKKSSKLDISCSFIRIFAAKMRSRLCKMLIKNQNLT